MQVCTCPQGASLPDIVQSTCPSNMGQIQKVVFQRLRKADGTENSIADPTVIASWTPLLIATDGSKVTTSPFLSAPEIAAGEARTYGGGNDTIDGIEMVLGSNPTTFTSKVLRAPSAVIASLKQMTCEADAKNLGVYIINENGQIISASDDPTTPTVYKPIPIVSLFVGDRAGGKFDEPDSNMVNWSFFPGWSDTLAFSTPTDFNAKTDLVKPSGV